MSQEKTDEKNSEQESGTMRSPDELDKYITISSNGVWLILVSIILLLSGFVFWVLTTDGSFIFRS